MQMVFDESNVKGAEQRDAYGRAALTHRAV